MSWLGVLLALHVLGAVVWVGGMAVALYVLRPNHAVPAPQTAGSLRRFFLYFWHAMPILLISGYAMLFGVFGGFANVNWAVHVMHLLGLIMAALFLTSFFGPWRTMLAANARDDFTSSVASLGRIRALMLATLALGVVTIVIAGWAV